MLLARLFWRVGINIKARSRSFLFTLSLVTCLAGYLHGQNLDLLNAPGSSVQRGMAGVGIALQTNIDPGERNPAGLFQQRERSFAVSGFLSYHTYELINERQEENLTRIFKWAKPRYTPIALHLSLPVGEQAGISIGFRNSISPFLYNQRRALTWSPLYNQLTKGNIQNSFLSFGFGLSEHLSLGLTGKMVIGMVTSEVHGENHGIDEDKWATLESEVSGWGLKTGLQYHAERYHIGVIFEPSSDLEVHYNRDISRDSLYQDLFPDGNSEKWISPVSLGLGITVQVNPELLFSLDIEKTGMSGKVPSINLYEYGGLPTGGTILNYRLGCQYSRKGLPPLRVGVAMLPQYYTSTVKTVLPDNSTEIVNSDRIQKLLYTFGTSIMCSRGALNLAVEYSSLTWEGYLNTYITVKDTYDEKGFGLVLEWIYNI